MNEGVACIKILAATRGDAANLKLTASNEQTKKPNLIDNQTNFKFNFANKLINY
jgi:hypothetical protein